MLKQLYIRNFTLIDELDITFHPGFSVITGETGAGKSIILGAIGLLLGQRADSKTIKTGADRCTIEAHFDISRYHLKAFFDNNDIDFDEHDCILRRELTAAGKSRSFINDTPVQLATTRELGEMLVDIHSQHQNLLLNKENFQLNVVDIIAADQKQLADYQTSYHDYQSAYMQLETLKAEIGKSRDNEEFLRFQYEELAEAKLIDGEQEALEQESKMMSHAEEIKSGLFAADQLLTAEEGIVNQLRKVSKSLDDVRQVYPEISEMAARVESSLIELKDIAQEISSNAENVEFDPARLEQMENRLDLIYRLQQKHHVQTVGELLTLQAGFEEQLNHIENSDEELHILEQRVIKLQNTSQEKAAALTSVRQKAAKKVEEEMKKRLVPLGIPNIRFSVELDSKSLSHDGADKISFLFSANTSTPLQPIAQVASGGEIARVMLSLKAMISGAVKLPTIIFDEIDTGVSGKVAEMMARIMQEMGDHDRQVISITHLPQIAALGTTHYKVYKEETADGTISRMHPLTSDERVREIAQMLSGSDVTKAAVDNAKELLKR